MIHPASRSLEWMHKVADENNFRDMTLIEKTYHQQFLEI